MKLGASTVSTLKLGASQVSKVYLGATEVWSNGVPIVFAGLATLSSAVNASSYATAAAYQPTANALVLAVVTVTGPAVATPTFSGNDLTWVEVATLTHSSDTVRITVFRAMGSSPTSTVGTVSVTSSTSCSIRIVEFRNVKTSGANGADAVVQSGTNSGSSTTASVTLATLTGSANAVFAATSNITNPYTGTVETDWSEDYDGGNISPITGLLTTYRLATTDNSPTVTGPNQAWAMIALEISIP